VKFIEFKNCRFLADVITIQGDSPTNNKKALPKRKNKRKLKEEKKLAGTLSFRNL